MISAKQNNNQHKTKKITEKFIPVKASWEAQRKGIEIELHRERNPNLWGKMKIGEGILKTQTLEE